MEKRKIFFNEPELSSKKIAKGKDFAKLFAEYKKIAIPFYLTTKFIVSCFVAAGVFTGTILYVIHSNKTSETQNLVNNNIPIDTPDLTSSKEDNSQTEKHNSIGNKLSTSSLPEEKEKDYTENTLSEILPEPRDVEKEKTEKAIPDNLSKNPANSNDIKLARNQLKEKDKMDETLSSDISSPVKKDIVIGANLESLTSSSGSINKEKLSTSDKSSSSNTSKAKSQNNNNGVVESLALNKRNRISGIVPSNNFILKTFPPIQKELKFSNSDFGIIDTVLKENQETPVKVYSFDKHTLVVNGGVGMGIYFTKTKHADSTTYDRAASLIYSIGCEYGLMKWLGAGVSLSYDNYFVDRDSINVPSPSVYSLNGSAFINVHMIRSKRLDLLAGMSLGVSRFNYLTNNADNESAKATGSLFNIYVIPRFYIGKNFGVFSNISYPSFNYSSIKYTSNNSSFDNKLSFRGRGFNFGIGVQVKF